MEWSKELTTNLIELFREQRVLWAPTFRDFKSRNKKHDAWTDIAAELKTDTNEVEKKMGMLIGQFQREMKKGKSGDGADAPYKTKWCFFNMLLFLKEKNEPRHSSEGGISPKQDTDETQDNINAAEEEERSQPDEQVQNSTEKPQEKIVAKTIARMPITKASKRKAVDTKSEEAYAVMKQLSSSVKKRDEFDVYGEYVGTTLRNLKHKSMQIQAKFEINNVLYRAECSDTQPETFTTPQIPTSGSRGTQAYNTSEPSFSPSTTPTPATSPVAPVQTDSETCTGAEDQNGELNFTQLLSL